MLISLTFIQLVAGWHTKLVNSSHRRPGQSKAGRAVALTATYQMSDSGDWDSDLGKVEPWDPFSNFDGLCHGLMRRRCFFNKRFCHLWIASLLFKHGGEISLLGEPRLQQPVAACRKKYIFSQMKVCDRLRNSYRIWFRARPHKIQQFEGSQPAQACIWAFDVDKSHKH